MTTANSQVPLAAPGSSDSGQLSFGLPVSTRGTYRITPVGAVIFGPVMLARTAAFTVTLDPGVFFFSGSPKTTIQRLESTSPPLAAGSVLEVGGIYESLAASTGALPANSRRLISADYDVLAGGGKVEQREQAISQWSDVGAVSPGPLTMQAPELSEWSLFEGCTATCGRDAAIRVRTAVPPVHAGIAESLVIAKITPAMLEEYKTCDKPCRQESSMLSVFKQFTGTTVNQLPDLFSLSSLEIDGKSQPNPYHPANLIYLTDAELAEVLSQWKASTLPITSTHPSLTEWINWGMYRGELAAGSILPNGGVVVSKAYSTLLKYTGSSLQVLDAEGKVMKSYEVGLGDYLTIANSKVTVMKAATATKAASVVAAPSNSELRSASISTLRLTDFGVMGIHDSVVTLYFSSGDYELQASEGALIFSPTGSEIIFLKAEKAEFYWSAVSGYAIRVDGKITWQANRARMHINTADIAFRANPALPRSTTSPPDVVFKSSASAPIKKIVLSYTGRVDVVDDTEAVVACFGAAYKSIPSGVTFTRPSTGSLGFFSAQGSHMVNFQDDGNLVLYNMEGDVAKPLWATSTSSPPNTSGMVTHMRLEKTGSFVLWSDKVKTWAVEPPAGVTECLGLVMDSGYFLLSTLDTVTSKLSIYNCWPSVYSPALSAYVSEMYAKAPAFAVSTLASATSNTADTILALDDWLDTYNPNRCPPTHLTCSVPSSVDFKTIDIKIKASPWKEFGKVLRLGDMSSRGAWDPSKSWNIAGIPIGYKAMWGAGNKGSLTQPTIRIDGLHATSTAMLTGTWLIKLPEDEFAKDYAKHADVVTLFTSNPMPYVLAAMNLSDTGVFEMHPAYKLPAASTLTGGRTLLSDMVAERNYAMQEACYGKVLQDDCYLRLPRDQFFVDSVYHQCDTTGPHYDPADSEACKRAMVELAESNPPDLMRKQMATALTEAGIPLDEAINPDGSIVSSLVGLRTSAGSTLRGSRGDWLASLSSSRMGIAVLILAVAVAAATVLVGPVKLVALLKQITQVHFKPIAMMAANYSHVAGAAVAGYLMSRAYVSTRADAVATASDPVSIVSSAPD